MSTNSPAHPEAETLMTDRAYEVLDCFYEGIDDVVRELAVQCAARRDSRDPSDPSAILIEERDVRDAGAIVVQWLRQLSQDGRLSPESVSAMAECFECTPPTN